VAAECFFEVAGVLNDFAYVIPQCGFKLVSPDLGVATNALAAEPVGIRTGASIILKVPQTVAPSSLASHLAVERISTQGAAGQPLEQISWPSQSYSGAAAVFAELLLSGGEQ